LRENFDLLSKHKVISAEFTKRLRNMFGLEARLIFSVIDNGATTEFDFSPHNIGGVISLHLVL